MVFWLLAWVSLSLVATVLTFLVVHVQRLTTAVEAVRVLLAEDRVHTTKTGHDIDDLTANVDRGDLHFHLANQRLIDQRIADVRDD